MKAPRLCLQVLLGLWTGVGLAQSWNSPPHIGYVYPSGARQGGQVFVTVGGQYMRNVTGALLSGKGIKATVYEYQGRAPRLDAEQRKELARRLQDLRKKRMSKWPRGARLLPPEFAGMDENKDKKTEKVDLPDHPLINNMDKLSFGELQFLVSEFLRPNDSKRQPNAQIGETVLVEMSIAKDAEPGDREFRLQSGNGLSNPLCFQVGVLPEVMEPHPFDEGPARGDPLDLPVLMNGQIFPGDVDRFRINASQGQQIVVKTYARHLIPFLADAVPGWFQATLAVYGDDGAEVAYVDDYRFHPDPVLSYTIPRSGVYDIEIRDSIYRGREDFVYRIAVGELPFITDVFPIGTRANARPTATADGWNLSQTKVPLDGRSDGPEIREAELPRHAGLLDPLAYAVGRLPECEETQENDSLRTAQLITLPRVINGRIQEPGDVDYFRFRAGSGQEIVAEITARRLNSPMDSLVRLMDSSGNLIAWNDDHMDKKGHLHRDMGKLTDQSDSYLRTKLRSGGMFFLEVSDVRKHGGQGYSYRLRLSLPQPDFTLLVSPSTVNVRAGRAVPVSVHVLRKDGFTGEVVVRLKDAPDGFSLDGSTVPAGSDGVRMTLTAPNQPPAEPVSLRLEGRAQIAAKQVVRAAMPAEDLMQAFLWRHLLPSREFLVAITGGKNFQSPPTLDTHTPVRIPVGGGTEVRFKTKPTWQSTIENIQLVLEDPPQGIVIDKVKTSANGFEFTLLVDSSVEEDLVANLIVEAFIEREQRDSDGKPTGRTNRSSLGYLPAIPFQVVQR